VRFEWHYRDLMAAARGLNAMSKLRPTTDTGYWIADGWIYHPDQVKSAKYWITNGWIYGPVGSGTSVHTDYSIGENWIWGPAGKSGDGVDTGFWIQDGHIYGPTESLPFVNK
jgi:hypothetical protein